MYSDEVKQEDHAKIKEEAEDTKVKEEDGGVKVMEEGDARVKVEMDTEMTMDDVPAALSKVKKEEDVKVKEEDIAARG